MRKFPKSTRLAGSVAAATCLAMIPAAGASAQTGGIDPDGKSSGGTGTTDRPRRQGEDQRRRPGRRPRRAPRGRSSASSPPPTRSRTSPTSTGGGHGNWNDKGYDCSGAVSYALHGGGLLRTPLDSSGLGKYGDRGKGSWISVYGAPSHAYMVVAGLRFDTSMTPGNGPGWSKTMRSTAGELPGPPPQGPLGPGRQALSETAASGRPFRVSDPGRSGHSVRLRSPLDSPSSLER